MIKIITIALFFFTNLLAADLKLDEIFRGLNKPWSLTFIDNSRMFIENAENLRLNASLKYHIHTEGNEVIETFAKVPKSSEPKKIRLQVGDAMNLSDDIGQFDVIHAANLICRLPEPKKLLNPENSDPATPKTKEVRSENRNLAKFQIADVGFQKII